jgi:serine/threonine-protein kinase
LSLDFTDPKLGTTVAERYRLDERLGAGGMGVVYKGEEVPDGKRVAVKFLHEAFAGVPDLVKRFHREVAAMSRVRHENLVTVVDSGVAAGVPYLVMEFLAGKALAEVLERGALPPARAVRLAKQVLAGVAAAHEAGVVHRDLKPDNILLVGSGEDECVKILDFGLAKMVHGSEAGATQLTNTGFALGTPAYMAPEQARGTLTDHRADLYAVGVILYHMVVGRKPFVADSPMAVMRMHMDDAPQAPRQAAPDVNISTALERVILRAMQKDAAARWQDAASFMRALDGTPEGGGRDVPEDETLAGDERTRLGKRRVEESRARRRPLPIGRVLGAAGRVLLVTGIASVAYAGWSRLTHRDQQKMRRALDVAVDQAKSTLQKVATAMPDPLPAQPQKPSPPAQPPPPVEAHDDDDNDDRDPTPPRDTPGAQLEAAAPVDPPHAPAKKPLRFSDAVKLINAGKLDDGVQVLYQLRRKSPRSPDLALWLGHAYFRKLWRTDGLREYADALELRPSLRRDPQLLRNVVGALDDPTYRLARALLRKRVGASAVGELKRAAKDGKNAKVESRAARLALELAHARPRR